MANRHKKNRKGGVPERWLDYCPVGQRIPGTRFIAFKVPLKPCLNLLVPESCAFGLWDLLDAVKSQKHELGLIIDLTFTTRYYKLTDVPQSCSYIKIFIEGHKVPSDIAILSFKQAVRGFLKENQDNDKLIGVHCTHGLNRTGYLVCRYLIDVDGVDPPTALKLFNDNRGHCIERKNYLHDLLRAAKRSNYGIDEPGEEVIRGLAVVRPLLKAKDEEQQLQSPTDIQEHQPSDEVTTENKQAEEKCRRRTGNRRRANQKSCDKPAQHGLHTSTQPNMK
ncbi:RNA/RNP complex-1-interacting phosphatase-like [Melanotaenia boesemani]|uniref:RNA/RNP complex-1-interacting phosphatase-like n=1 Tax=Melanotaenia boesemani TaxID=1250792 RepID=UPI001C056FA3|nr:RNA/RNP complex-1-interacting phosphatase-like [Melanotaenia boesemani]XP_041867929.1 RNA/RNP complex-1-interacting phosphatase-like [Melanotaenia boesemani]